MDVSCGRSYILGKGFAGDGCQNGLKTGESRTISPIFMEIRTVFFEGVSFPYRQVKRSTISSSVNTFSTVSESLLF